ncbi:hypothetical protein [Heyndrickxia faecalis]
MYQFILNMWIMRKADSDYVKECVLKGYLTQEECDTILGTNQVSRVGLF